MKSWSQERDFVGSSRVRRKFGHSSDVLPELTEKSWSLPTKLVRTHQEDHREVQELAGSLLEHCQEIVGSSPERSSKARRKKSDLSYLEYILGIVVST